MAHRFVHSHALTGAMAPPVPAAPRLVAIEPGRLSLLYCFVVFFALISLIHAGHWAEPPFWDAAFSVFPAAQVLSETGFDFPSLLAAPTYKDGGPNVHANSLITLLSAIAFSVTDQPTTFIVLHFVHYAIAALTATLVFRWCVPIGGTAVAAVTAAATVSLPVFLAQAGQLYLELPSACLLMLAATAFASRSFTQAAIWAALAVSVKEAGIVVAGALGMASLLQKGGLWHRVRLAFAVTFPAVVVAFTHLLLHASHDTVDRMKLTDLLQSLWYYLKHVPDLLVLFVASVALAFITAYRFASGIDPNDEVEGRRLLCALSLISFAAFYTAITVAGWAFMLPRYFVPVVPMMVVLLSDTACRLFGRRLAIAALVSLCFVSLINIRGRFYPYAPGNNGAFAERSLEYRDLLAVHVDTALCAESIPNSSLILHGLVEHYLYSYPDSGYVSRSPENRRCIALDKDGVERSLSDLPDHTVLLISFWSLGGEELNRLKVAAEHDPNYYVHTSTIVHGLYQARVVRIMRLSMPQ